MAFLSPADSTFLLTELRVPLTWPDPAREVARRLREAGVDAPEREELESEGRLTGPVLAMADSFVHLQCIRLFGVEEEAEALVRGLWLRTLLSLARSP